MSEGETEGGRERRAATDGRPDEPPLPPEPDGDLRVYVPLRTHGFHSLMTGVDAPRILLERAQALGLPALALADVDSTAGWVDFLKTARRLAEEADAHGSRGEARGPSGGAHPSGGPPVAPRAILAAELSDPWEDGRLIALVTNETGFANLNKLVSARHLGFDNGEREAYGEGSEERGPDDFDLVRAAVRYQEGLVYLVDHPRLCIGLMGRVPAHNVLVAISPASLRADGGRSSQRVRTGEARNTHIRGARAAASLSGRSTTRPRPTETDDAPPSPSEAETLEPPKTPPPARPIPAGQLLDVARATGFGVVAVPDVYYAAPGGADDHRLRVAIKHNALLEDLPEEWLAPAHSHLPSAREMAALYADLDDAPGPWPRAERTTDAESGMGSSADAAAASSKPNRGAHASRAGATNDGSDDEPSASINPHADADAHATTLSPTYGSAPPIDLPPMVARTLQVAQRCQYTPPLDRVLFPEVDLEPGQSAYSKLCELAFDGAQQRYRPLRPEIVRRLDYELGTIDGLGFAPYFLLVNQIGEYARAEDIPCVGRGSAADSLVAYCLKLTDADPFQYDLIFERFLNPTRKDRPDIDLDFCWRRRDDVIEHVYDLFGAHRTAMICTLNTCGLRSAFRETALACGFPPPVVNRWSKVLPYQAPSGASDFFDGSSTPANEDNAAGRVAEAPASGALGEATEPRSNALPRAHAERLGGTAQHVADTQASDTHGATRHGGHTPDDLTHNEIARAFASTPEAREFPFDDERWQQVLRLAQGLIGAPRHFGLHPGGVVVAPGSITDFAACQRAAKGVVVTQLDKDAIEAIGLVKMDLLGNRALTVLDDTLKALAARGVEVDLEAIAEDDGATGDTLAEGRSLACFQVESPGMRNLLQQTGARNMDAVIQAVALIRPGPAGCGMKDAYVRRFRGLERPTPPHPRLVDVLWETQGVMLYQEDVMRVAQTLAGMDLSEADMLRRALQKRRTGELAPLAKRFQDGCAEQGIARADARNAWDLVANFASFGFCKAHAVTYGRIAYRAVWLKTHHPAVYMCAFLNSHTGYYKPRVYVEEARRLGAAILPPDVNRSELEFSVEWLGGDAQAPSAHAQTKVDSSQARATSARPTGAASAPPTTSAARETDVTPGAQSTEASRSRTGAAARGGAGGLPAGVLRASDPDETVSPGTPALRVGLGRIKGLSMALLERLAAARTRGGPFLSLPDLLERARPHRDEAENLIQCGALDGFDRTRPELLWRLHLLLGDARRVPKECSRGGADGLDVGQLDACRSTPETRTQERVAAARANTTGWRGGIGLGKAKLAPGESASLFAPPPTPALVLPGLPDLSRRERGVLEYELMGLTVADHPTRLFPTPSDERIARTFPRLARDATLGQRERGIGSGGPVNPRGCADVRALPGGRVTLRGWLVASRRVGTKDGKWMRFLTLEDPTGLAEVVLWPDVYQRDGHRLTEFGVLCVTGVVQDQLGARTVEAQRIW